MTFDSIKICNDLPLLLPKAELETKAVLRKAIVANKALAELKGAGKRVLLDQNFRHPCTDGKSDMSKNTVFLDTFL